MKSDISAGVAAAQAQPAIGNSRILLRSDGSSGWSVGAGRSMVRFAALHAPYMLGW